MGLYNILKVRMPCPHCSKVVDMEIEIKFGEAWQYEYRLGDEYRWRQGKVMRNGGRPEQGTLSGDGYAECASCRKDFWVIVHVADDVLDRVEVNPNKQPYKQSER